LVEKYRSALRILVRTGFFSGHPGCAIVGHYRGRSHVTTTGCRRSAVRRRIPRFWMIGSANMELCGCCRHLHASPPSIGFMNAARATQRSKVWEYWNRQTGTEHSFHLAVQDLARAWLLRFTTGNALRQLKNERTSPRPTPKGHSRVRLIHLRSPYACTRHSRWPFGCPRSPL
jgi:hypothetical protein